MKHLSVGQRNLHTTPNRFAKLGERWSYTYGHPRMEHGHPDAICFKGKDNFCIDYLAMFCHSHFSFVTEMCSKVKVT